MPVILCKNCGHPSQSHSNTQCVSKIKNTLPCPCKKYDEEIIDSLEKLI